MSGIVDRNYSYRRVDDDFDVGEFEQLTAMQTVDGSRLIWRTMVDTVKPNQLIATYQHNTKSPRREAPSQLVHRLIEAPWVPQKDGTFVRPKDAARELPEGFLFDDGYEWLRKVHFGEANRQAVEESRAKEKEALAQEAVAQEMGFLDAKTLEQAKEFATLPQDEREWLLAESRRRQSRELPRREPRDPEQRADRVRQEAANALAKTVEERSRSVSLGRDDIKKQAEPYLIGQYTIDGEMICQICQEPLPFKRNDGTWFFEKVEFISMLTRHHHQNYLALCPNHAAMFLYANGSNETLRDLFSQFEGNELQVVLVQRDMKIYFTATHIADLRAIVDAERAG